MEISITRMLLVIISSLLTGRYSVDKSSLQEANCNGRVQNTSGDGPGGKDTETCVAQEAGFRDCYSTEGEGAFSNTEDLFEDSSTSACITQISN